MDQKDWKKPRVPDEFVLPNKAEDPEGHKKAIEQGRTRLRLEFKDRQGFELFLRSKQILEQLKETSYSEQGPEDVIITHLYYLREKRGRIIDFLAPKWQPFLKDVTVDRGLICNSVDLEDELSAAIHNLKNKPDESQGEKSVSQVAAATAAEVNLKKRKRVSGEGSLVIEKDLKDIKKVKKQEKIELLEKQVHILGKKMEQLVSFTGTILYKIQSTDDISTLKQDFNGILETLQQDVGITC